ncbi:MAG: hypothetical protein M0Q14_06685 [Tissierellaceae bacterium]|nr:hypothetical protein [Tissierellaceae bacterium]
MNYDYPELHYIIYPKVVEALDKYFEKTRTIEDISGEEIEIAVHAVYKKMVQEHPEIHGDPSERRYRAKEKNKLKSFYGRGKVVKDLISILIITELFRRKQNITV